MNKIVPAIIIFGFFCFSIQAMESNKCYWDDLPLEISTEIFSFLPGKNKKISDLIELKLVNKNFKEIVNLHSLSSVKDYWVQGRSLDDLFVFAIQAGNLKLTNNLVNMGIAGIDCKTKAGLTIACINGHKKIAKILIRNGGDINEKDDSNNTPLFWTADTLCRAYTSARNGDNFISLNGSEPIPVSLALERCRAVFRLLVKKGADVNIKGWCGTVLMLTAKSGDIELAKLLIANDANVLFQDKNGNAITQASINGHTDMVKLLLENGADSQAQDTEGLNALRKAVIHGKKDVVVLLVNAGANINQKSQSWFTLLMDAALYGQIEIVNFLIEHGAEVNATTIDRDTALIKAASKGHTEVVEILISNGANINVQNRSTYSALMLAARNGHTKTVNSLVRSNANRALTTQWGATALDIARSYQEDTKENRSEIIGLLSTN